MQTCCTSIISCKCIIKTYTSAKYLLWSVRGTLWGGYMACDAVSTMHEWGGRAHAARVGSFPIASAKAPDPKGRAG